MTSTQHEHISKKRILYTVPGMDNVIVRRDHEYAGRETGSLTMDLYYPADAGHRACRMEHARRESLPWRADIRCARRQRTRASRA